MPYFQTTAEVEVYVDEFLDSCSTSDKEEILETLLDEAEKSDSLKKIFKDLLSDRSPDLSGPSPALGSKNLSYAQEEFMNSLNKLNQGYYQLTIEELESINKIAKRF